MMFWVSVFIDIVELIVWPATIILIFFKFKEPLVDVIRRISGFKVGGNEVILNGQMSEIRMSPKAEVEIPSDALEDLIEPYLAEVDGIKGSLSRFPQEQQLQRVINQLSIERIDTAYARIYRGIYSSQIDLLMELNRTENKSASLVASKFHYESAVKRSPKTYVNYNEESWRRFLVTNNLITIGGDHMNLTEFGAGYVRWMENNSLNLAPDSN